MFSWFTSFMIKGSKNPLTSDDLYNLKPTDGAAAINESWNKNWSQEVERKANKQGGTTVTNGSILLPLVKTFGGMFLVASLIRMANILIQVVSCFPTCFAKNAF